MNAYAFLPTFLATVLTVLVTISALGLSQRMRKRAEKWLIPLLVILAVVCLAAFLIYLFSAGSIPAELKP
jgi:hypothetical protein